MMCVSSATYPYKYVSPTLTGTKSLINSNLLVG